MKAGGFFPPVQKQLYMRMHLRRVHGGHLTYTRSDTQLRFVRFRRIDIGFTAVILRDEKAGKNRFIQDFTQLQRFGPEDIRGTGNQFITRDTNVAVCHHIAKDKLQSCRKTFR